MQGAFSGGQNPDSCASPTPAGVASVFQLAPDSGVKGSLASASFRPKGGSNAEVSAPKCVSRVRFFARFICFKLTVVGAFVGSRHHTNTLHPR